MNTHAEKNNQKDGRSVADEVAKKDGADADLSTFVDNRPETVAQRKLQAAAQESSQVNRLKTVGDRVNGGAPAPIQRQEMGEDGLALETATASGPVVQEKALAASGVVQRQSVPGVAGYGNFVDLGNGLFGTTQPTDAGEVSGLVAEMRTKAAKAGVHQNIKVLTGTHGDASGHLVGETMFYTEDMAHEGHKVAEGGWINVLNVQGKSKETIAGWMDPGSSAIILAWCYSKTSSEKWENVHCYKNGSDYQSGKKVW